MSAARVRLRSSFLRLAFFVLALAALVAASQLPGLQLGGAGHARPAAAAGQDPIFMNYAGITGDVTADGYTGWIELTSFQWGVGRTFTASASGADREGSAPSVSEIVVTKLQDSASAKLLKEALGGEGKTVVIDFTKSTKGTQQPYLEITLSNVLISKFSMSSGGDRPTESISLNFTRIQYKNITFSTGVSEIVCWDLSQQGLVC